MSHAAWTYLPRPDRVLCETTMDLFLGALYRAAADRKHPFLLQGVKRLANVSTYTYVYWVRN
jgi:hypothetical protein